MASEANLSDKEIMLAVYSHLSRLYVSSYASFFTSLAASIVLVSAVVLRSDAVKGIDPIWPIFLNLVILGSAGFFLLRTWMFGKTIRHIQEKCLVFTKGLDVNHWLERDLYPKDTHFEKLVHGLFENSWPFAIIVIALVSFGSTVLIWLCLS